MIGMRAHSRMHAPAARRGPAPAPARAMARAAPRPAALVADRRLLGAPATPASEALRRATAAPMRLHAAGSRAAGMAVEANLFSRLVRVIKSYVSNLTAQFEDPELLLDRCVDEMQEDLIKMRQATARVMASERQMSAKYNSSQATADEWLRRAELAVRKGEDGLAREALARRKAAESAAAALKGQLDSQRRALEQLQANMRMLEGKLGEAKNKRESLKARAASAKSSKQVQEMVAGLRFNSTNAWAAFDRMEDKVVALEAEAESVGILATPDSLEQRFSALEGGSGVDDELAALKRGLLAPPAPGAGLGRPLAEVLVREGGAGGGAKRVAVDAIDAELEELRKRARM